MSASMLLSIERHVLDKAMWKIVSGCYFYLSVDDISYDVRSKCTRHHSSSILL